MAEVQITSAPESESGELILGKFKTTADLEQAYKALETKLGSNFAQTSEEIAATSETPATTEAIPPTTTDNQETPESVYGEGLVSAVSAAGLDITKVAEEWASESGVSTETRAALDKAFGSQAVDAYFKGLEAQQGDISKEAEAAVQGIVTAVGGEESWNTVATWAGGTNGPADLVDAYNGALDRGDAVTMKALALALKGAYETANGTLKSASVVTGQASGATVAAGFRSQAELMSAMRDPRYSTDAAFREDVAQRLKRTEGFDVR